MPRKRTPTLGDPIAEVTGASVCLALIAALLLAGPPPATGGDGGALAGQRHRVIVTSDIGGSLPP